MELPSFWQKQEKPLFSDLEWNFPEKKQGSVSIIGGNSQNFSSVNFVSGKMAQDFPIETITSILPDALRRKIPPVPGVEFLPSTDSGSFKKSSEFSSALASADFNLLIGDFSKNSETAVAVSEAIKKSEKPILLTRDTIDLVLNDAQDFIEKENLFFVGSMAQIQKLFRAVYYPKVLLLSMPILPVVEALHKFTISYPCVILTFHEGQILVASSGKVISTPIEKTPFSPLSLWNGELAARIVAYNLFNPKKPLEATVAAIPFRTPETSSQNHLF